MLNLKFEAEPHPSIKNLVTEFRRVQVSRFPIDVVVREDIPHFAYFVDSRFPVDRLTRHNTLGYLKYEGLCDDGRFKMQLRSRLIQNEKYKIHNEKYNIRETNDPKKMLKWLKEYIKPYSSTEIIHETGGHIDGDHDTWRNETWGAFTSKVRELKASEIAQEIMHLQTLGVTFKSDKFRELATTGLDLYAEAKRRKAIPTENMHVFIQPDESVMVSLPKSQKLPIGSWVYENMDKTPECVQQQIAMLRLSPIEQYVPEVGRMVNSRTFWIHVNPNDFNPTNT
jgi:hypothetical protein